MQNGKLAVIGDADSVLAFKAIGAEVYSPKDLFEVSDTLKTLSKGDYAVIFITEQLASLATEQLNKMKTKPFPTVIPIPSCSGTTGYGMRGLHKDVEKAIGSDIL